MTSLKSHLTSKRSGSFLRRLPRVVLAACVVCSLPHSEAQPASPPATLQLPPSLAAAGTGVVVDGNAWGYVVWQATTPEWYQKNNIAIYLKSGNADSPQLFALQGTMAPLTDPAAITPWINRVQKLNAATGDLAENLTICANRAKDLIEMWSPTANPSIPASLADRLSLIAGRANQDANAAATLRTMGANHPVYRFVTGTGWAGPLNVPVGQDATIELREVSRSTGVEGSTVARVTLRAVNPSDARVSPDLTLATDQVVQVKPDWPAILPSPETVFPVPPPTPLPDLAPALRWSVPDELRRQVMLARGFMLWRSNSSIAMSTPANLLSNLPSLKKLLRNPAFASKLFSSLSGTSTGPGVADFASDRTTWFYADDNERYDFSVKPLSNADPVITGIAHAPGATYFYYAAPVDLLGRYGPPSTPRAATAFRTIPPAIPKIKAVENIVSSGNQRLRVTFAPSIVPAGGVSISRYLIFRDRAVNTSPATSQSLDAAINPTRNNELIYIGQVNQPANPTAQTELTFTDEALAPTLPAHYGQTYFYTIRAVQDVAGFGMNLSSPSPPSFGTVRDREGPPAPTGFVSVEGARPGITFLDQPATVSGNSSLPADTALLRFRFTRQSSGVAKVRLRVVRNFTDTDPPSFTVNTSPDLVFGKSDSLDYDYPVSSAAAGSVVLSIQAVSSNGRVGHWVANSSIPVTSFVPKNTYAIEIDSAASGVTDMQPGTFLWNPYFKKPSDGSNSVYSFTPVSQGDGTFSATFPGVIDATRSRSLLVQRRISAAAAWTNIKAARLPANSLQFSFTIGGVAIPSAEYRVWEIIDPAGSPEPTSFAHYPKSTDGLTIQPINITLTAPAGATEYRLYRRIDQGPLFLLKQDTGTWDPATVKTTVFNDGMLPPAGGTISYFGQTFDQHGNPSPLALLDQKVNVIPELPIPVLDVLESGGTLAAPRMVVRASCPSPGVSQMELIITPSSEATVTLLPKPGSQSQLFNFTPGGLPSSPQLFNATAVSPTVSTLPPDQPFIYTNSIPIKPGVEYTLQLRALGLYDTVGALTAEQKFTWTEPLAGSAIPWPARAGPAAVTWNSQIVAFRNLPEYQQIVISPGDTRNISDLSPGFRPVAVQIGNIPLTSASPREEVGTSNWYGFRGELPIVGNVDLIAFYDLPGQTSSGPANLFHQYLAPKIKNQGDIPFQDFSQKLLPIVLYRQQTHRSIAGVSTAITGADLVQVTPMIENIAWTPSGTAAILIDPYVGVLERNPLGTGSPSFALCLFDTAPAATGATYRYFLVHFSPEYEPDGIIDAGSVTIPATP